MSTGISVMTGYCWVQAHIHTTHMHIHTYTHVHVCTHTYIHTCYHKCGKQEDFGIPRKRKERGREGGREGGREEKGGEEERLKCDGQMGE